MLDLLFFLVIAVVSLVSGGAVIWWWWQRKWDVFSAAYLQMEKEVDRAKAVFEAGARMQREAASTQAVAAEMQAKVQALSEEAQRVKQEAARLLKEERIRSEGIIRQKHKMMVNAIAAAERRSRKADGISRIHIDKEGTISRNPPSQSKMTVNRP
ncbi:TPA: hypothetical protein JC757_005074 [Salmonella enterica subsp. diarizonae]|nr:hypothetical protein [Salmonella enterica subsp. diarizonae]